MVVKVHAAVKAGMSRLHQAEAVTGAKIFVTGVLQIWDYVTRLGKSSYQAREMSVVVQCTELSMMKDAKWDGDGLGKEMVRKRGKWERVEGGGGQVVTSGTCLDQARGGVLESKRGEGRGEGAVAGEAGGWGRTPTKQQAKSRETAPGMVLQPAACTTKQQRAGRCPNRTAAAPRPKRGAWSKTGETGDAHPLHFKLLLLLLLVILLQSPGAEIYSIVLYRPLCARVVRDLCR